MYSNKRYRVPGLIQKHSSGWKLLEMTSELTALLSLKFTQHRLSSTDCQARHTEHSLPLQESFVPVETTELQEGQSACLRSHSN